MTQDEAMQVLKSGLPFMIRHKNQPAVDADDFGVWVVGNEILTCYPYLPECDDWGPAFWTVEGDDEEWQRLANNMSDQYELVDYFKDPTGPSKCTCDFYSVILTRGCQCGGV